MVWHRQADRHAPQSRLEALVNDAGLVREAKARVFIILPLIISVTFSIALYSFRAEIMQQLLPGPSIFAGATTSADTASESEPYALESEWYEDTPEPVHTNALPPGPGPADQWFPVAEAEAEAESEPLGEAESLPGEEAVAESETGQHSAANRSSAAAAGAPPPEREAVAGPPPVARRGLVSRGSKSNGSPQVVDSEESEPVYFEINDATSGFLGNLGLAFGLVYGFVFARSYQRFDSMMSVFYAEVAAIHKLVLLVQTVQLPRPAVVTMVNNLRHYTSQCKYEMVSGIMLYESDHVEVMTRLYAVVPALRMMVKKSGETSHDMAELNGAVAEVMLGTIGELCNLRYERWSWSRKSIPWVLWILIILTAMLMFFGVLILQSGWIMLDALFCLLTVAAISLLMFCLADVDQTHTGFMRIPVDRLDQLNFDIPDQAVMHSSQKEAVTKAWKSLTAMAASSNRLRASITGTTWRRRPATDLRSNSGTSTSCDSSSPTQVGSTTPDGADSGKRVAWAEESPASSKRLVIDALQQWSSRLVATDSAYQEAAPAEGEAAACPPALNSLQQALVMFSDDTQHLLDGASGSHPAPSSHELGPPSSSAPPRAAAAPPDSVSVDLSGAWL